MKLYISAGALILLGLVYLPAVIWFLQKLWKKLPPRLPVRLAVTLVAFLTAAAIPLWDVTITSARMAKLCPQVGMFIKRSVKVEGFLSNLGGGDTLKKGYRYLERREYDGRYTIYTAQRDMVQKEEFGAKTYQPKSRYEFIYDKESGAYKGRRDIGVQKSVVRDRKTNEELGYSLRYKAYPGWVDRNTISRIGQVLWSCHAYSDQETRLVNQVLNPN